MIRFLPDLTGEVAARFVNLAASNPSRIQSFQNNCLPGIINAMNRMLLPRVLGAGLGMALILGCNSSRVTPSTVVPPGEAATGVPEEPATPSEIIRLAAAEPLAPVGGAGWRSLFDGSSLHGWRVTNFGVVGRVELRPGLMVFWMGGPFTGVNYTNAVPRLNYEVTLEAMRVAGEDFFCGLTFPVGESFASLIVGGWGGTVVGISSIDGDDASENETSQTMTFETGRWYRLRLRVSQQKIEAWIDQKQVVNVVTTGRRLSLRAGDIELSKPFGLASWLTSAAFRDIKIREVAGPADPAP